MIYTYECKCSATFQAELPYKDRYRVRCPVCEGTAELEHEYLSGGELQHHGEPGGTLTIIIQPVHWSMTYVPGIITESQCEAKYGKDWRETPGSRRMYNDEPERIYSGTHSGPTRRKGKSFLNHSQATDSPQVQAMREAKMVKERIGK